MPAFGKRKEEARPKKDLEGSLDEGIKLFNTREYDEAIKRFTVVLQEDPRNAKAHRWIGTAKFILEDYAEAEKEFKKAIELDPYDNVAHNNLGGLYDKLKRPEEAEETLKKAVDLNPSEAVGHYNYGILLSKHGKIREAQSEFKKTLYINSNFLMAYGELFNLLMKTQQMDVKTRWAVFMESEQDFKNAIEKLPDVPFLHSYLGYVLLNTERKDAAESEFTKALKLNPKDQLAQVFLLMRQRGDWKSVGIPKPKD